MLKKMIFPYTAQELDDVLKACIELKEYRPEDYIYTGNISVGEPDDVPI
ncbi:hypothetical protein [Spirosoma pollinicola]|nr:hypothetical protein [Spirosoma pollinicola]